MAEQMNVAVTAAIKRAAEALRERAASVKGEMEQPEHEKLKGTSVEQACLRKIEEDQQAADLLDGYAKRHGSDPKTGA